MANGWPHFEQEEGKYHLYFGVDDLWRVNQGNEGKFDAAHRAAWCSAAAAEDGRVAEGAQEWQISSGGQNVPHVLQVTISSGA